MRKKINYSVILDGTVVDTRKSHRDYTHAVVSHDTRTEEDDPNTYSVNYCGTLALAEKSKGDHLRPTYTMKTFHGTKVYKRDLTGMIVTIVPVTIDNPNRELA
jgi:hypothetical protein